MNKSLVAYFSASGVTAKTAQALAKAANAELFEIKPAEKYSKADLDWTDKNSRSTIEMKNPDSRPAIKEKLIGIENYDVVFIGFPIWWYTAPAIIKTFLSSYDFSGKKIILFATSGGSSIGDTVDDLKAVCPNANFITAKILNNCPEDDLKKWVDSLDL